MLHAAAPFDPDHRFYVVGNGPSLTRSLLAHLPDGAWLGMNSAFRYWHRIGRYPRYYACLDPVVADSQSDGIRALFARPEIRGFFLHDSLAGQLGEPLARDPRITWLSDYLARTGNAVPLSRLGYQKQTTGALATRYVIEQGHRNLMLIGIDCKYVERIEESEARDGIELQVTQQPRHNPNYFFEDYQATGDRYQVPNPRVHSGNLHLQSFVALKNDLDVAGWPARIAVGSNHSLLARFGVFGVESIWQALGIRRIGAVVVPLTSREIERQVANFRLWADRRLAPSLEARPKGTVLHFLLTDDDGEAPAARLQAGLQDCAELRHFFADFRITQLDIPPEINHYIRDAASTDSPSTKSGPNVAFLAGMAQLEDYDYVIQMETDCVPIRAGWLDAAELEIDRAGTEAWIIGTAYFGASRLSSAYLYHLNGNAIYRTGDARFQAFLHGPFTALLEFLLPAGFRDLAYDTALSVGYFNIEALPEDLRRELQACLPRLAHTRYIWNVGGNAETRDPDRVDLDALLASSDETYLLHGRAALAILDRGLARFPEFYRHASERPDDHLALFSTWAGAPSASVVPKGYGEVELVSDGAEACGPEGCHLLLNFIRLTARGGPRRFLGRFETADGAFALTGVDLLLRDALGAQTTCPCAVERMVDADGVRYQVEARVDDVGTAVTAGLYARSLAWTGPGLVLREVTLLEVDETAGAGAAQTVHLHACGQNRASQEAVERWGQVYERMRRAPRAPDALLVDWSSCGVQLERFSFDGGQPALTLRSARAEDLRPPKGLPLFTAVAAGLDWHGAEAFTATLSLDDACATGIARVRLCRNGHTPWEYVDLDLQVADGLAIAQHRGVVFHHDHAQWRIEVLRLDVLGQASGFELTVLAQGPVAREAVEQVAQTQAADSTDAVTARAARPAEAHVSAPAQAPALAVVPGPVPGRVPDDDKDTRTPAVPAWPVLPRAGGRRPARSTLPRTLLLDPTLLGSDSATGQLKALLFGPWARDELLQVWDTHGQHGRLALARFDRPDRTRIDTTLDAALAECRRFEPELIYVRPTDDPFFLRVIVEIVQAFDVPVAVHVMDDWMERARSARPDDFDGIAGALRQLVARADHHFSICRRMSEMLSVRYGRTWLPIANGVDLAQVQAAGPAPTTARDDGQPFVIRYLGGLAEDMSLRSVLRVAQAVDRLHDDLPVRLEIFTMPWYVEGARAAFSGLRGVTVDRQVPAERYEATLREAGALLVAYNFDATSLAYTRYSFSNKLPECLASGRPVIVLGPPEASTVAEMAGSGAALVLSEDSDAAVEDAIRALATSARMRADLTGRARALLAERFDAAAMTRAFTGALMAGRAADAQEDVGAAAARSDLGVAEANRLYRSGEIRPAFDAYATLYARLGTEMYARNARLCLRRLQLDDATLHHRVAARP